MILLQMMMMILFFVKNYREEFREKYKKEHPNNKSVAAVSESDPTPIIRFYMS